MRWVQKYISAFGGDPTKVTMYVPVIKYSDWRSPQLRWGESAGSQSVALHLVANGGNNEGLFRAAVMQSGSPPPYGDITEGQALYDTIVQETGCSGSSDTLQCLRALPFTVLKAAIDKSPGVFDFQVSCGRSSFSRSS